MTASEVTSPRAKRGSIMWLREPVLILTISVGVLGLLFAIRRIIAETPVVTSSDGAASDAGAPRGNAGVIAPPPLIFLAFLALAAVLELLAPSPMANLFPCARYVVGAQRLVSRNGLPAVCAADDALVLAP